MEEPGDLGFVGIADDKADAWESRDFFGRALGVTTGYEDARCRIGSVNFANGVAGLRISRGGDCAGVENYDVGQRRIGRERAALFAQLAFDGRAIRLGGATAELLDKKGAHWRKTPAFYLSIRARGVTAASGGGALRQVVGPIQF